MNLDTTQSYTITDKYENSYQVNWAKYNGLSEEYAMHMEKLSKLGVPSFKKVDLDFLNTYPQAFEEDPTLTPLKDLSQEDLSEAMDQRIRSMFVIPPSQMSPEMKGFMKEVTYYLFELIEPSSDQAKGFALFMKSPMLGENVFKITAVVIDESVRRRGLASALLQSLDKTDEVVEKVLISTRPTNTAAIKTWRSLGFIETKTQNPHFVDGHWVHFEK